MTSFVEQIAPLIQKHAPKYNIKVVSPIIAQAILESASGTSELAVKAHNYFGLKYRKGRCPTATGIYQKVGSEQMDTGLYVSSMMQWCKFPNMEDGVIGYFDFINVANYANLKGITSPEQYLINIKQDGYATSKNYVQNLMNVIGKYGLTKYDKKGDEVMAYTNSGLVTTKLLAPYSNTWGARTHAIDTITIHCTAGQGTAYSIASIFQPVSRRASCNYSVGYDGSIGLVVEEKNASGCTSNKENDERAITIEVSTTNYHPYQCTDKAYDATIRLVADICKRNGIKQLKWSTNKSDRVNHRNGCNMTVHRDYENKTCVPISSEVLTKDGWVRIDEIEIGDEIACADLDNLNISFEEIYDKVPIKEQDTYTSNGLTATSDHRMVYRLQKQDFYRIDNFKNLFKKDGVYIPLAGYYNGNGLKMTDELMTFLIATQADGHYMYDVMKNGTKSYYGLEFHLKKERKISRIKEILLSLNLEFKESVQSDGSTKIRIYNQDGINIVDDICEKHLKNKCFTWNWIDMSKKQAEKFLDEILLWDGCLQANLYSSSCKENLDVVSAISSLNGVGSKVYGNNISFREKPFITLGEQKRNSKQHGTEKTKVCCVSVKTGIFLMRQKGKTFIVGNCPGDYLYNRMGDIASKVNTMLAKQSVTGTMQQSALTKVVYDYTLYDTFVSRYYGKGVDFDGAYGNQCLTSGHLVSMADGTYKPVEEVEVGDALLGGNTVVSNDVATKEVLKVETTFGTFTTTKDHRFIGEDGTEMRAKNLVVGDTIQFDKSEPEEVFHLTEDELRYLGFYLGDGTKTYRWKNSTIPQVFVTVGTVLKEEYLESLDVHLRKNTHSNGRAHTYSLVNKSHKELAKVIHYMNKKELPRVFTKEQYKYIIDGYTHADGSVRRSITYITSTCKELLTSIQYGCTLNGWLAKLSEPLYRDKTNYCDHPKPLYKLSIYKKQKPICKVVSVCATEDDDVFILNTDGNHLYYADNVLHHNCWDYVAQYAKVLGHTLPNCTQTGYVKDIANLKATNGILKWCDDIALNGQEMKKGDIIIWDGGQFPLSHIAIYTGRDSGNNGIYLGQNQPYPYGNERVFTSANMIGCFRPKVFKKTEVAEGNINYRVHCQTYGWLGYVYDGKMAGTTGKSKRVEAMQIYTTDGTVIEQVDAHMQSIGWKSYKAPNKSTIIGTTGKAKRLEALRIKTSKPCKMRGHVQKQGWGEWVDCDGKAMIGTTGKSLRLEAIEIKRV